MKKLNQLSMELREKVKRIDTDKEVFELGFNCQGKLCEFQGYEKFFERLWVWSKIEKDNVYIIVTADNGNSYCSIAYTDMYIGEIVNDTINEEHYNATI